MTTLADMSREALEALCESRRLRADANAQMFKAEKARADEACRDRDKHFFEMIELRKERARLVLQLAALRSGQPSG